MDHIRFHVVAQIKLIGKRKARVPLHSMVTAEMTTLLDSVAGMGI